MTKTLLVEQTLAALDSAGRGLDKRQLARVLRLRPAQKSELKTILLQLLSDGQIEKTDRKKFRRIGQLPPVLVVNFFGRDQDGELLARPDKATDQVTTIRLAPGEAASGPKTIGVGNRALVRVSTDEDGYLARIIRKLERQDQDPVLGVIAKHCDHWQVQSISRKNKTSYALRPQDQSQVTQDDLVRVAPVPGRHEGLQLVKLVEKIGSLGQAKAASVLALAEHGIKEGFSVEELQQAKAATAPTLGNRDDLRQLPLITIDPDDARDFDDAIHAHLDTDSKNPNGWVVWVAIADVAAFVPPGSALDTGARRRGNSVYLPDRVVPMLPERLSADLCSLRPLEDRACMAVRMVFDAKGNKRAHKFVRGLMRSHARLTYTQAQAAIDGQTDEITAPLLEPVLQPLWQAYRAVQAARSERSPLEIETSERKIRIGERGEVISIKAKARLDAHRLVEEFMVQANVCAAQTLEQKQQPLIFRVHETPEQAKIYALADFLSSIGMKWAKAQRPTPARFNQLLRKVSGTELEQMVNQMVLRSQMRAIYDTNNIGHFGLSLDRYAHFTSPIRRYADLTIHRALILACQLGTDGTSEQEQVELSAIAQQITKTERAAMAAERDAASRYIAAFLSDQIQATFHARISGVTSFGLFLTLDETGADGLVPIRSLGNEYFHHDQQAQMLIGRDSGGKYRLGMMVEVTLLEANAATGGLIFKMLSKAEPGARPKSQRFAAKGRKRKPSKSFKRKKRKA